MAASYNAYVNTVKDRLNKALCLYNIPGVQPEHPEIEFPSSPEFKLENIMVERNSSECCLIEPTINSARISLRIKQTDELERWLTHKWISFVTQAAYAEVHPPGYRPLTLYR